MRTFLFAAALLAAGPAQAQVNLELVEVRAPTDATAGSEIRVAFDLELESPSPVNDVAWEVLLTPGVDLDRGTSLASGSIDALTGDRTVAVDATIPVDRLGRWRVAVRVDGSDRIEELNEFDNVAFSPDVLRVTEPRPDFVVDRVEASAPEVSPGDAITISARVRNLGAAAGTATARAVLTAGGVPTASDAEVGQQAVSLDPGGSVALRLDGVTPDVLAGAYRPGVWLGPAQTDANPGDDAAVGAEPLTVVKDFVTLLTEDLVAGVVGLDYFVRLIADGGDGDFAFSVVSGALPPGLRLEDAAIVGAPTESGTYAFDLDVTSRGLSDRAAFEIEVLPTDRALLVVTSTLPEARLGVAYGQLLVAGGGEGPYDWAVIDGALPPGLTLQGDLVAGEPTELGVFDFTVQATDRLGDTATRAFRIEVSTSNSVLFDPEPLPVAAAGVPYEAQLSASGGVPPYRWRALSEPPVGLTLSTSGRLRGTPGRPGDFIFRVEVTDSTDRGIFDRSLVFLTVEDPDNFTIVRPEIPTLRFGNRFELVFDVDGGVRPYTWSLAPGSQLPRNTFFASGEGEQAERGVLFGAPSELGTYGIGIVVEDGQGRRRFAELALRVEPASATAASGGGCRCVGQSGGRAGGVGLVLLSGLLAFGLRGRRRRSPRAPSSAAGSIRS